MIKKIIVIAINLLIIACIVLIGIAPIISTAIAGSIASANGCDLDEGSIHPCLINGVDYGEMLYTLGVMGWLMLASIPIAAGLFVIYLVVWGIILIVKLVLKLRNRNKSTAVLSQE
jgi:hypothetical protein